MKYVLFESVPRFFGGLVGSHTEAHYSFLGRGGRHLSRFTVVFGVCLCVFLIGPHILNRWVGHFRRFAVAFFLTPTARLKTCPVQGVPLSEAPSDWGRLCNSASGWI